MIYRDNMTIKELEEVIKKTEEFLVNLQRKTQETSANLIFLKGKLEGLKERDGDTKTRTSVKKDGRVNKE